MYVFVLTLHVILCALLTLIILMQPGKGGDVSSAFGGGAATQLFGASGPGNFLTKGTGAIATLFMVTSITLALYSTDAARSGGDVGGEFEEVIEEGEEGGGFGTTPANPAAVPPVEAPTVVPAPAGGVPAAPPGQPAAAPGAGNPSGGPVPGAPAPGAPAGGATPAGTGGPSGQ